MLSKTSLSPTRRALHGWPMFSTFFRVTWVCVIWSFLFGLFPSDFGVRFGQAQTMTSGQAQTYTQTSSPMINPYRGRWDWMTEDAFDNFAEEFNGIQPWNCRLRRGYFMDINTVSQRIQFNTMLQV